MSTRLNVESMGIQREHTHRQGDTPGPFFVSIGKGYCHGCPAVADWKSIVICCSNSKWAADEISREEPAGFYANKMGGKSVPFTPLYHRRLHNDVCVESEEKFSSPAHYYVVSIRYERQKRRRRFQTNCTLASSRKISPLVRYSDSRSLSRLSCQLKPILPLTKWISSSAQDFIQTIDDYSERSGTLIIHSRAFNGRSYTWFERFKRRFTQDTLRPISHCVALERRKSIHQRLSVNRA